MKVLLVGSGGREHALALALSGSPLLQELLIAPGSPALGKLGRLVAVPVEETDQLCALAEKEQVDLVVIGPELPLVNGLADRLDKLGIAAFGPRAAAARLEGSKEFARAFCARHAIPQPAFAAFDEPAGAIGFANSLNGYCVVKADGLAAGKGVVVCDDSAMAEQAIHAMLDGQFGAASRRILIEERISGPEISAFALLDGPEAVWMASARDHKRAFDKDQGPNTGGMGAVSPSPHETEALREEIMARIIQPVAKSMAAEGTPYTGILYAGLMLTKDGPKVIEFNCRFGDPEAQVILPRLKSDLLSAMLTQTEGGLSHFDMRWSPDHAVTVVLASTGYPGRYQTGSQIKGLDALEDQPDLVAYHAGTSLDEEGQITAAGGRVLAITGLGPDSQTARARAYQGVDMIDWPEGFCRRDIAAAS